eukprot:Gregarina_sp_Poly_1__10316@NODE_729_length_6566_cov_116_680412_g546_i0_p1_GENE_NODE_729_length_6566_cov_116_680412_g546_i0NODE_729_length_6566_cov_116_680412_g546_i0_p1_ORF_typecomplete_len553_score58_04PP2C/PF00481_21/0_00013PP2C/PF00481_21/1_9e37PP2C_2/PF13672_6/0_22PP2C_2/PF13672_6/0_00074SpoIIE/PF07228_12/2_8e02SpoIIE/PF07228_12/0_0058_NODE_729_length_6566_cov_116_680412_g546_i08842542
MSFEWEDVDLNWSRCEKHNLWLHKHTKWIYELRVSDNTFVPLRHQDSDKNDNIPLQPTLPFKLHKCAAAATMQGRRPCQEDGFSIIKNWLISEQNINTRVPNEEVDLDLSLIIVCDGHGGSTATKYVLERLPQAIKGNLTANSEKHEKGIFRELVEAAGKLNTSRSHPCTSSSETTISQDTLTNVCDKAGSSTDSEQLSLTDSQNPIEERPAKKVKRDFHAASLSPTDFLSPEQTADTLSSSKSCSVLLPDLLTSKIENAAETTSCGSTEAEKSPLTVGVECGAQKTLPCRTMPVDDDDWSDKMISDVKDATVRSFDEVDRNFMKTLRTARDGCTAAVVYFLGDHAIVAGCGDTRVIMAAKADVLGAGNVLGKVGGSTDADAWYAYRLTVDHKPSLPSERLRIAEKGGIVRRIGPCLRVLPHGFQESLKQQDMAAILGKGSRERVMVALAVSRAFGDRRHKENDLVIVTPDVQHVHLRAETHYAMIIASDGVWDVVDDTSALAWIKKYWPHRAREAASALITEAYDRGSMDNLTCVVIFFYPVVEAGTQDAG